MNTLDERIIFYFSGQNVTGHTAGMYPYYLQRFLPNGMATEVIFIGNFYYNGSDTSITFDLTDIIASDGFVIKEDDFESVYSMNNKICNKYFLSIVWSDEVIVTSSNRWVAKVYSYHNKNLSSYKGYTFFEPSSYNMNRVTILQQGFNPSKNKDSKLVPHFPMYDDEQIQNENNCPFALSLLVGNAVSSATLSFQVEGNAYDETVDYQRDTTIIPSGNSFTYISNISNVAWYTDIVPTKDGVLWLTDEQFVTTLLSPDLEWEGTYLYRRYRQGDRNNTYTYKYAYVRINNSHGKFIDNPSVDINSIDTTNIVYCELQFPDAFDSAYSSGGTEYVIGDDGEYIGSYRYKVGILDKDYKRYYIFWQDRYGSFQCQPFNCFANYSETFDRSEVVDYQNRRRNSNIQVQSKWNIYSGWIDEDLYPYYESIYTSPVVILYDTAYDTRYSVLVSGNYEEKTYRNQKKMINMNLELIENKKQNIIY